MKRLWVRLSLMLAGVLFFVFFLQFVSIITDTGAGLEHAKPGETTDLSPILDAQDAEIARRLVNFGVLSLVVGLVGGIVISRIVVSPIDELVKAAQQIGDGKLDIRVKPRGSQEIQELAHSINQMASALKHSETLRNNLMADVSHELRTPLTVMDGNLRAILDHVYTLDDAGVANLYEQNRHLIRLVNDLRELALAEARRLPMEKAPTQLNVLIAEILQAVEPLAGEKGVTLLNQLDPLPETQVDPLRLRQVFFNLMTNALRHTPPGGTITIQGKALPGEISLSVTDTGEGLEKEQIEVVFDRFYRGDKSRSRDTGGTGLGLAIAKAIIEAHGGAITAYSEGKGCGCVFTISLPLGS